MKIIKNFNLNVSKLNINIGLMYLMKNQNYLENNGNLVV